MAFASIRQFMALKAQVGELEARVQALEGYKSAGTPEPEPIPSVADTLPLHELLGDKVANLLVHMDFSSVKAINAATDKELEAINGIGEATVKTIRYQLEGM